MNKNAFRLLAIASVAAGLASAWLAAPLFHTHTSDPDAIAPMWADHFDSLEAMAAGVDAVVLGTVESVRPGRLVETTTEPVPFTLADLRVERALRGEVADVITVEQTGGDVDGRSIYVDGDGGLYAAGERTLLFLKRQPETGYYYLVNPQGRFRVSRGELRAVAPDDPVAQQLDLRPVDRALERLAGRR